MARVFCLQHRELYDRRTGVQFEAMTPRVVREDTDDLGRTTTLYAQSFAEVDEADLDHYRDRPHLFYVPSDEGDAPEAEAEAEGFRIEHRSGPWHDVVDPEGERVNDKALSQEDAEALLAEVAGGES